MNRLNRLGRKLQELYFGLKLFVYGRLKLPAQTKQDRRLFKKILDHLNVDVLSIFEWGSGFSSIYYADYLRKKGIPFEWHSIDSNRIWHEEIKKIVKARGLDSCVKLYLKEFQPFWEKSGWGRLPLASGAFAPQSDSEKSYIDFPKQLKRDFNVVFIDARFRRRCLQTAREIVRDNGVVILHDAHKEHYQVGLESFPFRMFIPTGSWYPFQKSPNQVWIGSKTNDVIMSRLKAI
ncbi:MAG: class I SAM-dependent methyltransferase [Deltaproteobacteria bacterium]|nr:class I SAM-dependent methyltransferase [Deltaproteobacteria bacterium]